MSGNENADEKNVCRLLLPPRAPPSHAPPGSLSLSLLLDLTDTRACCCSNQLGIIIPWGLHEVLRGLRQHLLVVHTSFPPTYSFYTVIERVHSNCNFFFHLKSEKRLKNQNLSCIWFGSWAMRFWFEVDTYSSFTMKDLGLNCIMLRKCSYQTGCLKFFSSPNVQHMPCGI